MRILGSGALCISGQLTGGARAAGSLSHPEPQTPVPGSWEMTNLDTT